MSNTFSFQFDEQTIDEAKAELVKRREAQPGKTFVLSISVDLIPDGIGFDAHNLRVAVTEPEAESQPQEAPAPLIMASTMPRCPVCPDEPKLTYTSIIGWYCPQCGGVPLGQKGLPV